MSGRSQPRSVYQFARNAHNEIVCLFDVCLMRRDVVCLLAPAAPFIIDLPKRQGATPKTRLRQRANTPAQILCENPRA